MVTGSNVLTLLRTIDPTPGARLLRWLPLRQPVPSRSSCLPATPLVRHWLPASLGLAETRPGSPHKPLGVKKNGWNYLRSCRRNLSRVAVAYIPTVFKILEAFMVDKDRIQGSAEQAKGKVKEVIGKVTGDSKLEGEGQADQLKGKVQNAVGGLKDTLRGK
jgi:uncharacterized protein YjbJ (UPF0337 family)